MDFSNDRQILRELAIKVKEIAGKPKQSTRRELWRSLNSLKMVRPMVNVNGFMWWREVYPDDSLLCVHPVCRAAERGLRQSIFHDWIGDDTVIEPWVVVKAVYGEPYKFSPGCASMLVPAENVWGISFGALQADEEGGAWAIDPVLTSPGDFKQMTRPRHVIDEKATAENFRIIEDLIGDILSVIVDRGPMVREYNSSIIHDLCLLRGLENLYCDMHDDPQWLHRVLAFMTYAIRDLHEEVEETGDLKLINSFNQSMTYCDELKDPSPDDIPVKRSQLWHFFEAQEFTCVSPQLTDEFALQYHKILAREYGLCAYGCCEDLTHKIRYLKAIPNLRCIAVTPWADAAKCAEQIGGDYVLSWRPNPSLHLCNGFDSGVVKKDIKESFSKTRGCNIEINLKDVKTIKSDINAVRKWTEIAIDIAENIR